MTSNSQLRSLLALAAGIGAAGFQATANTAYTQQRDKQRAEQVAALEKKQRIRAQIRARKETK